MKRHLKFQCLAALSAVLLLLPTSHALAHAGHDNAPGEDGAPATNGPITISAEAKTNLKLTVEEADLRTLEKTVTVIGQIQSIPNRTSAVTSRISGRVTAINATEGERVKKGQPLIKVESRQIGNPPPSVQYEAPIDGIVTHRDVLLNDSVEPDKHLLEIVDMSELYAEGRIFEGQVSQVKVGQNVRIVVESFPDVSFSGTVDLLDGQLDPESRTLKVWVRVANPDRKLLPNMRATLHIVTDQAESVVAVPHSAVLGDAGNLFVFVQTDDNGLIYERRPVVAGIKDDRYVEIIEGVFPSDKVVTLGNYQLQYVVMPKKSSAAAPAAVEGAHGTADLHNEKATTGTGPLATLRGPLTWMGGTIIVLLCLNLIAVLMRRRGAATDAEQPLPPTDNRPSATTK